MEPYFYDLKLPLNDLDIFPKIRLFQIFDIIIYIKNMFEILEFQYGLALGNVILNWVKFYFQLFYFMSSFHNNIT